MEQHREDRKEPEVEINEEPEDYPSLTKYKNPKRSIAFNKWFLIPILLLGTFGVAFGLWMISQSNIFSSKKQAETPELKALRTEVQNLKGEIASSKNEFQFLKEEQKALKDWTKALQEQVAALKNQQKVLAKRKDSPEDKKTRPKVTVYKTQKGETLASIAKKFRVSQDDLRNWNSLPSKGKLKPGQTITVYSPTP
jgi:LysM repeat protein